MFSTIRQLIEVLQALSKAVRDIADQLPAVLDRGADAAELAARLEDLELSRARWEAEIDALILKADSSFKSAAAAESRARTMKRSYEKIAGELDPDRLDELEVEGRRRVQDRDAEASEEEGVPLMRPDLAGLSLNSKVLAQRLKFMT